jgi:hypothetical protein
MFRQLGNYTCPKAKGLQVCFVNCPLVFNFSDMVVALPKNPITRNCDNMEL